MTQRTMIRRIADAYGESWLVYTCRPDTAWVLHVCCGSRRQAENAARRWRRAQIAV